MCRQMFQDEPMRIGDVPFRVETCPKHTHAIGELATPSGLPISLTATAKTRAKLAEKLSKLVQDANTLVLALEQIPIAALLLFQLSIVDPGAKVSELDESARADIETAFEAMLSGDAGPLLDLSNRALSAMGPGFSLDDQKIAEAHYAEMIRQGWNRAISVPLFQRAYNLRGRLYG